MPFKKTALYLVILSFSLYSLAPAPFVFAEEISQNESGVLVPVKSLDAQPVIIETAPAPIERSAVNSADFLNDSPLSFPEEKIAIKAMSETHLRFWRG